MSHESSFDFCFLQLNLKFSQSATTLLQAELLVASSAVCTSYHTTLCNKGQRAVC